MLGYWLLPLPTIDPLVVARSGAALPAYGPKFRYSHYAGTKTLRFAAGGAAAVAGLGLAAQVPPLRNLLLARIKQGDGPDESRRAKSWFTRRLRRRGRRPHASTPGSPAATPATARPPRCSPSRRCAWPSTTTPTTAGQVTTAQAMGDNLIARLEKAGIMFEVVG